ncbi:MAG: hypothetical protein RAP70_05585, partial [Candidatus Celaenobacter antarcticus]|nr:hypothetical protein [Candidatus Celaenobacter antarcticus]
MNHERTVFTTLRRSRHERREINRMIFYRIFFLKTIFVLLVHFVVKNIYSKESIHWLRVILKAVPKL